MLTYILMMSLQAFDAYALNIAWHIDVITNESLDTSVASYNIIANIK